MGQGVGAGGWDRVLGQGVGTGGWGRGTMTRWSLPGGKLTLRVDRVEPGPGEARRGAFRADSAPHPEPFGVLQARLVIRAAVAEAREAHWGRMGLCCTVLQLHLAPQLRMPT